MCAGRKTPTASSKWWFCLTWLLRLAVREELGFSDERCCAARKSRPARKREVMGRAAVAFLVVAALALLNCWFFVAFVPRHGAASDEDEAAVLPSPRVSDTSARIEIDAPAAAPVAPDAVSIDPPLEIDNSPAPGDQSTDPSPNSRAPPGDWDTYDDPIREFASPECDISIGEWIPDPGKTLPYTNETCPYIQPSQNCMSNGRPDRGFLDWRWKPRDCELEALVAAEFLEWMRGKKLVFIGDSIARNHMQSLLCALAQVEEPEKIFFDTKDKEMRWGFRAHNFTLSHLWSPFLARHEFVDEVYHIHLDRPEPVWRSQLRDFDFAVMSAGYWFFRPSVYYSNNTILGCNPRSHLNLTVFEVLPAYRLAHRNMLRFMLRRFAGVTVLRTVTVDHFEHGSWNTGGLCNRTEPFDPEAPPELPWMSNEMKTIQEEEFASALRDARGASRRHRHRLRVLNVTSSSFMRPDGHPNSYRAQPANETPQNDCLHWCLPGPIDTWNQLLFRILKSAPAEKRYKLRQFNKGRGGSA